VEGLVVLHHIKLHVAFLCELDICQSSEKGKKREKMNLKSILILTSDDRDGVQIGAT
jgi:hypothetical protein